MKRIEYFYTLGVRPFNTLLLVLIINHSLTTTGRDPKGNFLIGLSPLESFWLHT